MKNNLILSGHQPDFIPWLGVFYKLANCDIFRICDYVNFTKSYTHRSKILHNGSPFWLTIPIDKQTTKGSIKDVTINNQVNWKDRILTLLAYSYKKAKHFDTIEPILEKISNSSTNYLSELNILLIIELCRILDIKTKIVIGSKYNIKKGKTSHIIDSCRIFKCTTFLSGQGSQYLDINMFLESNINLVTSPFVHPKNKNKNSIAQGLSVLHYLSYYGADWVKSQIKNEKSRDY